MKTVQLRFDLVVQECSKSAQLADSKAFRLFVLLRRFVQESVCGMVRNEARNYL